RRPMMPPKSETPLTPEELALIKLWIDQGAKAPTGMRVKPIVVVAPPPATVQPVKAVVVSPDKKIVIASRGNQLHVYDADKGEYVKTLFDPNLTTADKKPIKAAHVSLVEALALSPDGKLLACAGADNVIKVWDFDKGEQVRTIAAAGKQLTRLVFIGTTDQFVTCSGDAQVKAWNLGGGTTGTFSGNADFVYAVGTSP